MCDVSMAMLAFSGLGAATQAYGAYSSAKGAQNAYNYNAQVGDMQARDALDRGHRDAVRQQGRTARAIGEQRAALGASGIDLGSGSALDILAGTDIVGAVDTATILENADREAWAYRTGATMDRYKAKAQSPLMAGGSALLNGVGSVAKQWYALSETGAI